MMDFSGSAGQASDFDLLPKGLLVFAVLTVRGVKTSATPSKYLDVELTVDQGQPFAGRKLWDVIGDPTFDGNSEKFRQMGQLAITRILECSGAGPNNPEGYKIGDFSQLTGRRVAIKVGVEEGTGGHDDKNRVGEWLTPNPASQSGYKGYAKLAGGDHGLQSASPAPAANGFGGAPATSAPGGGFGNQQQTQQPAGGGFGGSGFQQPTQGSSGQASGFGATSADSKSSETHAAASPSSGERTTGGWLEQAQGAPQS